MKKPRAPFKNPFGKVKIKPELLPYLRWGAVTFLSIMVFFIFYFPLAQKMDYTHRQLGAMRGELDRVKATGFGALDPKELEVFRTRAQEFKNRLTNFKESATVLNLISEEAKKNTIEVVNIKSDPMVGVASQLLQTADPMKSIDARTRSPIAAVANIFRGSPQPAQNYSYLPIRVVLRGSAAAVAQFLQSLEETSSVYVVDQMTISKKKPDVPAVDCEMTINFFYKI